MSYPIRARSEGKRSITALRDAAARMIEALECRTLLSTYTVTTLAEAGVGTLRYEIKQANAHSGADTIVFASGLKGQITLASGMMEIGDTLGATTIQGPGASVITISGNHASNIFQVDGSATASISGLALINGKGFAPAGWLHTGSGAILDYGTLQLSNDSFTGNTATSAAGMVGGGILVIATSASKGSTISNCTFTANSAAAGGGAIAVVSGSLSLSDDSFTANSLTAASGSGGALELSGGTTSISGCTFNGNTAPHTTSSFGGGIDNHSSLSIVNSTFYGNKAGQGGAIANRGTLLLEDSTITANTAVSNGSTTGGGLYTNSNVSMYNTIVAGNFYTQSNGTNAAGDMAGSLINKLNTSDNLIGTGGSDGLDNNDIGDNLVGVANPGLAGLANNGGPTLTVALLPGSRAINRGNDTPPTGVTTDQRGKPRLTFGTLDLGAVQTQPGTSTGTVFNDHNANGKQDSGDSGLANVTVYLDLNDDGAFDDSEPSAVTKSGGVYTLTYLAGSYKLLQLLPSGFSQHSPAAPPKVTISAGTSTTGPNFSDTAIASTVSLVSQDRTIGGGYGIDPDYLPPDDGPGNAGNGQDANGFDPFDQNTETGHTFGPINQPEDPGVHSITVDARASQDSTLSTSQLTDSGSISATEDDGDGSAGATNATAESLFQVTFQVSGSEHYSLSSIISEAPLQVAGNPTYGAAYTLTLTGPGNQQLIGQPTSTQDEKQNTDTFNQSGTLAAGTYTLTLNVTARDQDDWFPSATYDLNFKFG